MALVDRANLAVANTVARDAFSEAFSQRVPGVAEQFTEVESIDGKTYELNPLSSFPGFSEWIASKTFKDVRADSVSAELKVYESSIAIPRIDIQYDRLNHLSRNIANWARQLDWLDQVVIPRLLANDLTGFNGQSLLADAHPNSNGTGDNLTTDALSFDAYRDARDAMMSFQDEDGNPIGRVPTALLVGPELERSALEITGSLRPYNVTSGGALDGGSNVVGTATLENYIGDAAVLVSQRITDASWFVMHLGTPGLRPFYAGVGREPDFVTRDDMDSDARFYNDLFEYSAEFDMALVCGLWSTIYGRSVGLE